jgi:hypothetical protein
MISKQAGRCSPMIWRDILLHQGRNATYTLKTKAGCSSETPVSTYQTTRYYNKDDNKKRKTSLICKLGKRIQKLTFETSYHVTKIQQQTRYCKGNFFS